MNATAENPELAKRWSEWLPWGNRRVSTLRFSVLANTLLRPPQSGVVHRLDQRMQKMFDVSQTGVQSSAGTVELMVRYSREGCPSCPASAVVVEAAL